MNNLAYEPYVRRASASQINMLHGCRMQWYQAYVLKNKQPQTAAMAKGTLLHSVSESFYDLNINTAGIHSDDYVEKFKAWGWKVFDNELDVPRKYFSKILPSISESLHEMFPNSVDYAFEIADCKQMVSELLDTFLRDYKVKLAKYGNTRQAWYVCRPSKTELELKTDDALGYIDELLEINGEFIIVDLKSSNAYKTLFSNSHRRQLQIYAFLLYEQTGKVASHGIIKWIRSGYESHYELGVDGIEAGKTEIEWYKRITVSEDINDYPCNTEYLFCTCNAAKIEKNRGKGWCYWAPECNKILGCEDEEN